MSMRHLKQPLKVALLATISVSLLSAPLYAVDLPDQLASVNTVVEDNISETQSTADSLDVPAAEEAGAGYTRVYFPDRDTWEAIPADTPIRFRGNATGVFWSDADTGRLASVGGLYSGHASVELEEDGVYVVSYTRPEPLLGPTEVPGYTRPPSEGSLELLPETEERLSFDSEGGFYGAAIVSGLVHLINMLIFDPPPDPGDPRLFVPFLAGGLAGSVLGFQQTEQESPDNIAENARRRRELEREQRQIESENEELLEEANEEIREQNSQLGYILIEEVQSGQTTHLWVSE